MKKCKHNRDPEFCCECRYGKLSNGWKRPHDTLDEITHHIDRRLKKGYEKGD